MAGFETIRVISSQAAIIMCKILLVPILMMVQLPMHDEKQLILLFVVSIFDLV